MKTAWKKYLNPNNVKIQINRMEKKFPEKNSPVEFHAFLQSYFTRLSQLLHVGTHPVHYSRTLCKSFTMHIVKDFLKFRLFSFFSCATELQLPGDSCLLTSSAASIFLFHFNPKQRIWRVLMSCWSAGWGWRGERAAEWGRLGCCLQQIWQIYKTSCLLVNTQQKHNNNCN